MLFILVINALVLLLAIWYRALGPFSSYYSKSDYETICCVHIVSINGLIVIQVFLWDAETWRLVDRLSGHSLTVIQMEFSPCDNFLLTVSRDRTWSLFTRGIENKFTRIAYTDKSTSVHQRLIWWDFIYVFWFFKNSEEIIQCIKGNEANELVWVKLYVILSYGLQIIKKLFTL